MIRTTAAPRLHAFLCAALSVSALLFTSAVSLRAQDPDHVKQLVATRQCQNCDLRNAQIVSVNLNRADLTGADLTGAFLYRSTLRGAELQDAKFTDADLKGVDLSGARHAALTGAITDAQTTCPNGKPGPCK